MTIREEVSSTVLIDARRTELVSQLRELNEHVGKKDVDTYIRAIQLQKGLHLSFGIHSNKFVIVDAYGATVIQ